MLPPKPVATRLPPSAALQQALLDTTAELVIVCDPTGRITYANPAATRVLSSPGADLLACPLHETIHPDDRPRYAVAFARLLGTPGLCVELNYRLRHPDGTWHWVAATFTSLFADSSVQGLLATIRDRTPVQRTDEALQAREELVRTLLQQVPNGSVNVFDRDLRYLLAAGHGLTQGGLTPDAVIGKTLAEVFPPDAVAAVTPYYQRAFAGEAVTFELEVAGQWYRLHAAPLPEAAGAPAAIIAVAHNVTARKQAEERLHFLTEISTLLARSLDYETTLRTIVDLAVPRVADWCSLNLVDAHGTFVRVAARHVDPQKEALLNDLRTRFPPAPVPPLRVPSGMYQEATLVPEVREADLQRFATRPEQRAVYQTLGVRSLLSVPLRAGEQLRGLLILVTAESGRTYGADDLLLAQDLASRAVVALENARLYRQVQEALRLRDELLALVSHDLKNPLGVIQLQAELLQRRLEGSAEAAPERTRERLAQITASATTMARLIEDLLDVARLHLGATLALNRHPTDLVALVRRQVLDQALDQQQRIRIEAAETVVVGDWDSVRVERVVANLLSNAIKYSPAGGEIVLTITREAHAGQPWAVLTVQDAGLGIPAPDLPAIFDRFQRAGNVAGRVSGAGIGLTSARQIVEQHGGSITVASTEGVGSTFTVRLPLGRPEVTCGVEGQPGHGA